jgi:Putative peptidoglycan binding domain
MRCFPVVLGAVALLSVAPTMPANARDAEEVGDFLRDRGYRDIRVNEVSACRNGDLYRFHLDRDGRVIDRRIIGQCDERYYRAPDRDYGYYRAPERDYGPTYGYRSGDDFDDYVREVQRLLNRRGYDVSVDGILGEETREAVARFQARHGLEVDGEPGPQTLAALREGP